MFKWFTMSNLVIVAPLQASFLFKMYAEMEKKHFKWILKCTRIK